MKHTLANPLDAKLMNLTASVLFVVFAVLVLATLAGWVARAPLFAIAGITVTGDVAHSNALTLRANVAPRLAGGFFTLDLAQARQAFEAVPWVRRAVVRRDFPNRLKVVLQEHQAVAHWGLEAEARLLNSYGEIFEANTAEIEQDTLPRLIGPDGQAATVLAMYQALQPLFEGMDLAVDQFEQTGAGAWRLRLESGAAVELGRGTVEEVVARTQRFLKTLTQVTSKYGRTVEALESADLRHTDGYALRLHGVTTQAPAGQRK
jgi:cell division protein FtsQ